MKKIPKMYTDPKLSYRIKDQMSLDKCYQLYDELNTILLLLKAFFQAGELCTVTEIRILTCYYRLLLQTACFSWLFSYLRAVPIIGMTLKSSVSPLHAGEPTNSACRKPVFWSACGLSAIH